MAVCTSSCLQIGTRKTLRQMMSSVTVLPENVTCIQNGEIYPMLDELRSSPKLIVYIDSLGCTSCKLNQLTVYHRLFDLSESSNLFSLYIIFSPNKNRAENLIKTIQQYRYPFPVYVDYDGVFGENNPFIPKNAQFRTFLVNSKGTPVFVGNPLSSNHLMELFIQQLIKTN